MSKPLHFEPRESSPLDFYAAAHASAASGDLPDPYYGAQIEEIRAVEPECVAHRKYMERARESACNGLADKGKREPKKAPRVPRDSSEPAHLHVVLALLVFVGVCVTLLAASMLHGLGWLVGVIAQYADSLLPAVVRWIGGVL